MAEAESYVCHCCGASVAVDARTCKYCKNPVSITTFSSIRALPNTVIKKYIASYQKDLSDSPSDSGAALAVVFCYLQLRLYDKASEAIDNVIELNLTNSEVFFYAAVCMLGGKKAFLSPRARIDKALEYLEAARTIEPRAIYDYFAAYIKYDFFNRKGYRIEPSYDQELASAKARGLASGDVDHLHEVLSVDRPVELL